MTTLSEKDVVIFKKWLKSHLAYGPTTVIFTKKDGTERVMECTTNPSLVPKILQETPAIDLDVVKKERKVNEDVMPVYDLEAKAWKSFRWDSIKQVRFTLS
jgi:transaldolase